MSQDILLQLIDPDPDQPRKHFDEASIKELAQSIEANGLAVPILLRPAGDRFTIVHGERRWRAFKLLGRETIPAEVRDVEPEAARWLALVENVQRNDLSPIEEAQAYKRRLDEGITQVELGRRIGKSQSYIATKLRLLKLPDDVQQAIDAGAITEGHAKQLLRLKEPDKQSILAKWTQKEQLSITSVRSMIDELKDMPLSDFAFLVEFDLVLSRAMQEIDNIKKRLTEASDIIELKAISNEALEIRNKVAGFTLRAKARAGQLLNELQEAELDRTMSRDIPA